MLQSLKPEEYLHYRPVDWCYECGYRYPALLYGIGHDAKRFLITRYSEDEIDAMRAPFRGKACLVCGGEVLTHRWREKSQSYQPEGVRWFEDSPAGRLLEAKRDEWTAEIDGLELEGPQYYLAPQGDFEDAEKVAETDFRERRARKPMVRIEHKPSVDEILDLWRRQGRCVAFYWDKEPQGPAVCDGCGGRRLQVIFEWVDGGISGEGSCVE